MNQQATKFLGSSLKSVKTSPHKLGDLLVKAGYVTQRQIDDLSLLFNDSASVQLGQMLILERHINHDDLAAALRAQALIRDNLVDANTAIKALQLRRPLEISFDESLERIQDTAKPTNTRTNRLGELLVEAGIISQEHLTQSLKKSESTGLPLGRILILSGSVSESVLFAALNAQVLVRDKTLQREQAVRALAAAQQRQVPIEQSLKEIGVTIQRSRQEVRLGELLCAAALVDEADITNAIELGLTNALPVGEVLINEGLVSQHVLTSALKYQSLVREGQMDIWQAACALRDSQSMNIFAERAIEPPSAPTWEPLRYPDQEERAPHITPVEPSPAGTPINADPGHTKLSAEPAIHLATPPQQEPEPQPAVSDGTQRVLEFSDFLILTQVATPAQLKKASQMCAGTQFPMTRALVILNVTTKGIMELVTEAFLRVTSKRLSLNEAVFIVDFAREAFATQPANLQAILQQLGWDS